MSCRPGISDEEHAARAKRQAAIQTARDAVVEAAKGWEATDLSHEAGFDLCLALDALRKLEGGMKTKSTGPGVGPPIRLLHDRILLAALDFCKEEQGIRDSCRLLRRCSEFSRGEPEIGDPGAPSCNPDASPEERCTACNARYGAAPAYRGALKRRYAAKRRMMTAFAKLVPNAS